MEAREKAGSEDLSQVEGRGPWTALPGLVGPIRISRAEWWVILPDPFLIVPAPVLESKGGERGRGERAAKIEAQPPASQAWGGRQGNEMWRSLPELLYKSAMSSKSDTLVPAESEVK